jgi:hypothetical protein
MMIGSSIVAATPGLRAVDAEPAAKAAGRSAAKAAPGQVVEPALG